MSIITWRGIISILVLFEEPLVEWSKSHLKIKFSDRSLSITFSPSSGSFTFLYLALSFPVSALKSFFLRIDELRSAHNSQPNRQTHNRFTPFTKDRARSIDTHLNRRNQRKDRTQKQQHRRRRRSTKTTYFDIISIHFGWLCAHYLLFSFVQPFITNFFFLFLVFKMWQRYTTKGKDAGKWPSLLSSIDRSIDCGSAIMLYAKVFAEMQPHELSRNFKSVFIIKFFFTSYQSQKCSTQL